MGELSISSKYRPYSTTARSQTVVGLIDGVRVRSGLDPCLATCMQSTTVIREQVELFRDDVQLC